MEESVFVPSPNWFLPSCLSVTNDGWLIYGGPTKSLCVLEPLRDENGLIDGDQRFRAHVTPKPNSDKIVCVDIHPDWPNRRHFITGSFDGAVKEWILETVDNRYNCRCIHSHEIHSNEKEEVVSVGYSTDTIIITVGSFANIVKWDLSSNVVKTYSLIKNFRPTVATCSPHIPLQVAIGTKQGVIFLVDVTGNGQVLYKVRGQDEEVLKLTWCPQYEVKMQKTLDEAGRRKSKQNSNTRRKSQDESANWRNRDKVKPMSSAMQRLERIRNEPEPTMEPLVIPGLSAPEKATASNSVTAVDLEASGVDKTLPDDSFDDTVEVIEDDMFDIYKDHDPDEFGHKKFEPIDIYVKVKPEEKENDFLAECLKLKADILKNKKETEQSVTELVEAMKNTQVEDKSEGEDESEDEIEVEDKTQVDDETEVEDKTQDDDETEVEDKTQVDDETETETASSTSRLQNEPCSTHIQRHLLASIGKHCGIRIWSKTGKLVASCVVPTGNNKQNNKIKLSSWPCVHWYKVDSLLIADGKSQLLTCNPLIIDRKNKLEWSIVHTAHRRGLYCIISNAPKVQTPDMFEDPHFDDDWSIWTAGQDRLLIRYNMKQRKIIAKHLTCGGFVYNIKPCPYDASKLATGVGDGAVRVWECAVTDDDRKLAPGPVTMYWQNVQGKVLHVAWHPTKEHLLAFSTGESRVGLIDTSGRSEKPAKTLLPALNSGVYSMTWGVGMELYACGGGKLYMYYANKPDQCPILIPVIIEGQKWEVSFVAWNSYGLLVGSNGGGMALMSRRDGDIIAVHFAYTKMIHAMDWHPQQTSSSNEESKYKNLISVISFDKANTVQILEFKDKEGGGKEFAPFTKLTGNRATLLQQAWNPHRDGLLVTTAQDYIVKVWDISESACVAIFDGHVAYTLGVAWSPHPALPDHVLSGAGDCTLRVWRWQDYPPDNYHERRYRTETSSKKKKTQSNKDKKDNDENSIVATSIDIKLRVSKKFLFPITYKQLNNNLDVIRRLLFKHLKTHKEFKGLMEVVKENPHEYNTDCLKMFGSINDVNGLLERETNFHLEFHNFEAHVMLLIYRGRIDDMVKFATESDLLDPYLLSITPCVSYKYWKEVTQMYIAQIDRMVARGDDEKLQDSRFFGGAVYRKAASLLSIHDVKSAIEVLIGGRLYKEAYILCRIRHMDSIAEQIIHSWAYYNCMHVGNFLMGAILYLVLGDLSKAASTLGKSSDQEDLNLAAELAKVAGHNSLAQHIEQKAKDKEERQFISEEILEELPKRIELMLNVTQKGEVARLDESGANDNKNGDKVVESGDNVDENGDKVNKNGDKVVESGDKVVESGDNVIESGDNVVDSVNGKFEKDLANSNIDKGVDVVANGNVEGVTGECI